MTYDHEIIRGPRIPVSPRDDDDDDILFET